METRPAITLAHIRRITHTAKRNRTLIDPDTILHIINGEQKA